ncbi:nitroreductase family protein [Flavobacterium sp.]|uniref:nitroreductase family protein n=1 Tax=Flavobacterium sp. TaxID=239 RepID=UPI00286E91F5|nr:nitroreductase family protein [Flavobacterium sp.]
MTLVEIINYRRSVRHYKNQPIDNDKVKHCIELATLAPNSSNMQLWQFYHITNPEMLKKLAIACLNQQSATTAQQMVVFVTRQDLYRKRAKVMMELETQNVLKNSPIAKQEKRLKSWKMYYNRIMPFLYFRFFGIFGIIRKIIVNIVGLFRPIVYQVSENDMRVVVHKTCALAAQTFMLSMANEKYDTCPMEGFDSRKVKSILKLPYGAEINMVVSCGIRQENGVWGERMRIPFDEVYREI